MGTSISASRGQEEAPGGDHPGQESGAEARCMMGWHCALCPPVCLQCDQGVGGWGRPPDP